jgi:hypothetical protein
MRELRARYYTSYHFDDTDFRVKITRDESTFKIWLNGKNIWVNHTQLKYLKKMYEIIRKYDNIEEKMAALREYRLEQHQ